MSHALTIRAEHEDSASGDMTGSVATPLTFLVAAALLSIVLPAALLVSLPDAGRSSAWKLALVVAVWSGIRLSGVIASGQPRFFSFFFWLFTYIFMGIAPAVQIRIDQPALTTSDVPASLDNTTLWIVILGLACYEAGVWVAKTFTRSPSGNTASGRVRGNRSTTFSPGIAVAMMLFGLLMSVYYVTRIGLGTLFTSRDAAGLARAAVWPDLPIRAAVVSLAVYPTLIGLAALVQLYRATPNFGARTAYALLCVVGVATLFVVVNPISSARYTLGTVLFAFAVLFGAVATSARIRATLIAAVFGLFFLFPLADAFRRTAEVNAERNSFFGEYANNADYDSIWQVANAFDYWRQGLAHIGGQALGLPFFWVPRSIWPDKPFDTGVLLGTYHNYNAVNLSAPLWAEALINGGVIAVVLVFLMLGFAVRKLDDRLIDGGAHRDLWVVVGAAFPAYFLILLRGSLLQGVGAVAIVVVCLLILHLFRRPAAVSSPELAVDTVEQPVTDP